MRLTFIGADHEVTAAIIWNVEKRSFWWTVAWNRA